MASFNRVILAGNLTRDPELSYLPSGTPVCQIGLAVSRRWRDKEGNQRDEVCFVDVVAYARTAEVIKQYFQKGRPILVEGRLRYREWTSKEGQKRSKHEVMIENFSFIDGGGAGRGQAGAGAAPRAAEPVGEPEMPPAVEEPPPGGEDPNIPF
ncbi:MAG: single-stranded DNA-binding protein [Planctomycetes bacterium]|nr:single-stranded DNA-binding protein [Planctomycetota bacterium]